MRMCERFQGCCVPLAEFQERTMPRIFLLLVILGTGFSSIAQDTTVVERGMRNPEAGMEYARGPLLNSEQLERKKWYYSVEEGNRDPENVYKISLRDQDLEFFPLEVARFPNLQVLNLSANKIKVIPPDIEELKNLQILILADNKIKVLPPQLGELENLTQLYLGGNKLVVVPAWVGGLAKLRKLDLTFNRLTQYEIDQLQSRLPRCEITH